MKKLMIAVAIVCATAMSQAASIAWGNSGTKSGLYDIDGTTKISATLAGNYSLSVQLMMVGAEEDVAFATLSGKNAIASMTAGQLTGATTGYTYGSDASNGDKFYILLTMTKDGKDYQMKIDNSGENWALAATDNGGTDTFAWADGTYGGLAETATVGKWSAAAVPEPTSGLLLLLGMAGLALKRKRA